MTKQERIIKIDELSQEIHRFLAGHEKSAVEGATLIREYCDRFQANRADAEIALVQLLNQGRLETNIEMQLQLPAEKAV